MHSCSKEFVLSCSNPKMSRMPMKCEPGGPRDTALIRPTTQSKGGVHHLRQRVARLGGRLRRERTTIVSPSPRGSPLSSSSDSASAVPPSARAAATSDRASPPASASSSLPACARRRPKLDPLPSESTAARMRHTAAARPPQSRTVSSARGSAAPLLGVVDAVVTSSTAPAFERLPRARSAAGEPTTASPPRRR